MWHTSHPNFLGKFYIGKWQTSLLLSVLGIFFYQYMWQTSLLSFFIFLVYFMSVHVANHFCLFFQVYFVSVHVANITSFINFFGIFCISTCGKHH